MGVRQPRTESRVTVATKSVLARYILSRKASAGDEQQRKAGAGLLAMNPDVASFPIRHGSFPFSPKGC